MATIEPSAVRNAVANPAAVDRRRDRRDLGAAFGERVDDRSPRT
jgi:hypothetical protein